MVHENVIAWGVIAWSVFGALIALCAAHLSELTRDRWLEAAAACAVTSMCGATLSWAFDLPFNPLRIGFYVELVAIIAISGIMTGLWLPMAAWSFIALCLLVGPLVSVVTFAVPVATVGIAGLVMMTLWDMPAVAPDTLWKLLYSYAALVVAAFVLLLFARLSRA